MQDIDPRLKIIANHFGFQAQAEKAIEEMAELMVEIKHIEKRSESSAYDYVRLIEELADVKIMIDQLVFTIELRDLDILLEEMRDEMVKELREKVAPIPVFLTR